MKWKLIGVPSALPAWSVAVAVNVCSSPTIRCSTSRSPLTQFAATPSNVQVNAAPGSSLESAKSTPESPAWRAWRIVSGAAVSTVNVWEAGVASVLPAASRARTSNVCDPSLSFAAVNGVVHAANAAPSTRHSNVALPSGDVNAKVGVLSFVVDAIGVSVVSGATVSTVQVATAALESVFPAASTAWTRNVCEPWPRES